LKILRENGIKFFVRTKEYDLHNENEYFFIALYGLMGRTQSLSQSRKSVGSRIARAREGAPTGGKLPYGRTYDKKTGWAIDEGKKKIIEDSARRYLKGESLIDIAKMHGISMPQLNLILKWRSGDTWQQRFTSKRLNIDEIIPCTIPRLLPEEIILKIHERSQANRTYLHGQPIKHSYLLGRMIFCEICGCPLYGHQNQNRRYYRHARDRDRHSGEKGCTFFNYIPADIIEGAVIDDIFRMLGNLPRIEQAAKDAVPDLAEIEALKQGIEQAEKELIKIKKSKDNLIMQIEQGNISGEDVKERMSKLKEQEAFLKGQIDISTMKCAMIPTQQDLKRKSGLLLAMMRQILKSQAHLDEMSFDDKRKLLQTAFNGKTIDGKRLGVYISKSENGNWLYAIKGIFYDAKGEAKEIDHLDFAKKPLISDGGNNTDGQDDPDSYRRFRLREHGHRLWRLHRQTSGGTTNGLARHGRSPHSGTGDYRYLGFHWSATLPGIIPDHRKGARRSGRRHPEGLRGAVHPGRDSGGNAQGGRDHRGSDHRGRKKSRLDHPGSAGRTFSHRQGRDSWLHRRGRCP
jgi:predicted CopG family antitoxin